MFAFSRVSTYHSLVKRALNVQRVCSTVCSKSIAKPQFSQRICGFRTSGRCLAIADGGNPTHKPSPFQQKVLVWTKAYPSIEEVPERVTTAQMKRSMDWFRVRVSILMVCGTFIFAAVMALIGRKERMEGHGVTRDTLARRQAERER